MAEAETSVDTVLSQYQKKRKRKKRQAENAAAAAAATEQREQNEQSNHDIEQLVAQLTASNDEKVAQLKASNDEIVKLKLLLEQAEREIILRQLKIERLEGSLDMADNDSLKHEHAKF